MLSSGQVFCSLKGEVMSVPRGEYEMGLLSLALEFHTAASALTGFIEKEAVEGVYDENVIRMAINELIDFLDNFTGNGNLILKEKDGRKTDITSYPLLITTLQILKSNKINPRALISDLKKIFDEKLDEKTRRVHASKCWEIISGIVSSFLHRCARVQLLGVRPPSGPPPADIEGFWEDIAHPK